MRVAGNKWHAKFQQSRNSDDKLLFVNGSSTQ